MQLSEIRTYEAPRSLSASTRSSSDSSGFAPPPPPMAGDRAQIRNRAPQRAPQRQASSLALGWAALAFGVFALVIALGFGQLGGALGLLLGWLSAALAFSARRELMTLLDRALR